MDESSLTRLAIEEIVREMHEEQKQMKQKPVERKVNPLAKANKRFLGRTINSMITHNKRENDRKQENCRRKLKELDDRARRRLRNNYFSGGRSERRSNRSRSGSTYKVSSSSSSSSKDRSKRDKKKKSKKKKKKKQKKTRRHRSKSRSQSGSRSKKNHESKYKYEVDAENDEHCTNYEGPAASEYEYSPEQYYNSALQYSSLAAAYSHINNMCRFSTAMAASSVPDSHSNETEAVKIVELHSDEKQSEDDSISLSSSLSYSTSIEEDEHGMLTINLSSDEGHRKHRRYKSSPESDVELLACSDSDSKHMELSEKEAECIALDSESDSNSKSSHNSNKSVEILMSSTDSENDSNSKCSHRSNKSVAILLSSSNSDVPKPQESDDKVFPERTDVMIDLTEE